MSVVFLPARELPRDSLRSACNTLFGPRRAFNNVARALVWACQTLMDSSMMWRRNSVPVVWVEKCPC